MLTSLISFGNNSSTRLSPGELHGQISKRPLSFHQVIKLDTTLGNLKFANKGTKDPIFGIDTSAVMLNDVIKAFGNYSEYLEKSKGSAPVKATDIGKGLLMKEGVEIAVERVSIPKRRRSKTVIEQVAQYEEGENVVDSEMTEEDEEPLVRTRLSGVSIGGDARIESEEEGVDYSQKLKGLETISEAAQFKLNMKKARKANRHDFFIQYVQEAQVKDLAREEKNGDSQQGNVVQACVALADVHKTEPLLENPEATKVSSSLTLSAAEFTSQFLNDNPEMTVNDVLKYSVEPRPKSQVDVGELDNSVTRLEKKVHATSSFNLPEEIGKSVKAHFKNVLPKDVSDFGKIKMEKAAKKSLPKSSTTPFDQTALDIYN
ncbi:hypothetical protein Tco_0408547 [Tanacetum coccineum]